MISYDCVLVGGENNNKFWNFLAISVLKVAKIYEKFKSQQKVGLSDHSIGLSFYQTSFRIQINVLPGYLNFKESQKLVPMKYPKLNKRAMLWSLGRGQSQIWDKKL